MIVKYSSCKSKVTKRWAEHFPDFSIWKPGWLIRVHGPLVMGICLDGTRSVNQYRPYFHIHNLTSPCEGMTLDLRGQLRTAAGSQHTITIRSPDHNVDAHADTLKAQNPLLTETRLRFSQYVEAIADYILRSGGYPPYNYENILLTAAHLGETEYSHGEIQKFYMDLRDRDDYNKTPPWNLEDWRSNIIDIIENGRTREVVEDEKTKKKLNKFEDFGLEFDRPVRLFDLLGKSPG